ncbi:MAG: tetratricopeptide repeat protein [Bacteriovoracaceae bacterium]
MNSNFKRKQIFQTTLLAGIALCSLTLSGYINLKTPKPVPIITKQDTALNFNRDLLGIISMGNKRLLVDLIWIQTLIESDMDHYNSEDLKNWMYLRFKSIAHLDPNFYENYYWGGQYLSIVKDDLVGAADLLESGLKIFPNDFRLNYFLGFNYYFEMSDYQKGIFYLEKIINHPNAPKFIPSLILKMKVEMGFNYDTALIFLENQIKSAKEDNLKMKLTSDFYALKAERDLKCLNQKQSNCDIRDAEGHYYVLNNGRYYSQKMFRPYRLKKRGDQSAPSLINTFE